MKQTLKITLSGVNLTFNALLTTTQPASTGIALLKRVFQGAEVHQVENTHQAKISFSNCTTSFEVTVDLGESLETSVKAVQEAFPKATIEQTGEPLVTLTEAIVSSKQNKVAPADYRLKTAPYAGKLVREIPTGALMEWLAVDGRSLHPTDKLAIERYLTQGR